MNYLQCPNFTAARWSLRDRMKTHGMPVSVESWQGMATAGRPDMRTHELLNVTLHVPLNGGYETSPVPPTLPHFRQDIQPNLPWADAHFEERVGGIPLNPAPSWKDWPWALSAAKFHDANETFDHTYPERFWPRWAGITKMYNAKKAAKRAPKQQAVDERATTPAELDILHRNEDAAPNEGIRFPYGDLMDVVRLLVREPHTRQAFLPIFFPEDTSPHAKRKPCTLGYQFIMREAKLHCVYFMRSCDLVRHWADDAYLAVRLLLWVLNTCKNVELQKDDPILWHNTTPGSLTMHMTSLHIFENDRRTL